MSKTGLKRILSGAFLALVVLALSKQSPRADVPSADGVIASWPAGLFETRIVFTHPREPGIAKELVGTSIVYDTGRPTRQSPPADVARTSTTSDSKGTLRIAAARLEDQGHTLILTTDPHPREASYTLSIPRLKPILYDLSGVEVVIDDGAENPSPVWQGWWPVFDPSEARKRLKGSVGHETGFARLTRKGKLTLTSFVRFPRGPLLVQINTSAPVEATLGGESPGDNEAAARAKEGKATFRAESSGEPMLLSISVPIAGGDHLPVVTVAYQQADVKGEATSITEDRLTVPWAPPTPPALAPLENVPDLKGGNPKNGAVVFASADAKCATCHKVRGQGGNVGPELSSLVGHDRAEVYLDLFNPSARIHPDYVSYTIALKDGRVLVGTVRAKGADAIQVTDTEANVTILPRAEIEDVRPSATSIMPVGLVGAIGEAKLRDLIAFLTTDTPPVPAASK